MSEITSREMVLMRRAAEDACCAMNAHYGPFIEVIAKPLKIIALLDLIQSQAAKIDALKTQLNNMEACYIEKKKEVDELQARANKALSVTGNYCDEDDAALLVFVLEKALRGAND